MCATCSVEELAKSHSEALAWLREALERDSRRSGSFPASGLRDAWLLRMLRASDWDRESALERAATSLQWRSELDYDAIAAFVRAHPRPEEWPKGDVMMRYLPRHIVRTNAGVVVCQVEEHKDYASAEVHTTPAERRAFMMHHAVQACELIAERDEASGKIDAHLHYVLDSVGSGGAPLSWLMHMMPAWRALTELGGLTATVGGLYFCGPTSLRANLFLAALKAVWMRQEMAQLVASRCPPEVWRGMEQTPEAQACLSVMLGRYTSEEDEDGPAEPFAPMDTDNRSVE
ncbi:hypothetical protein EMIHUDRAFT_351530 [Emiliania huxleyi CCMP1516]|uniref:CRAL-TRIO domain-containing protein n=4 Tax=Emiliania huxleyi TaxID=2903 RepID=A0A0D3KV76_EMIH1|nr:hypothetical protein EMIHUDRAFT_351530 [Emiliania huxleyi CCMP1516]EOD39661.1 hypothetical protein EMIHUDRAFT_351530 [Emiliania huxleyi CCMP1516]|eukprot:XP_005792090.1 hypothetical protein EMIHUDRAFT_351530 [Emiliania huxleyi CCMP1516]